LTDPIGLRLADHKPCGEVANLEQPPDFADHAAKRELAPFFSRDPIGNQEHAKPRAADVRYVLQIDHDRVLAGPNQREQSIAELACGRAVEPTMGFEDGDFIDYAFHQLHAGAPIVVPITSSPTAAEQGGCPIGISAALGSDWLQAQALLAFFEYNLDAFCYSIA
jgi:hypothetical protein